MGGAVDRKWNLGVDFKLDWHGLFLIDGVFDIVAQELGVKWVVARVAAVEESDAVSI